MGKAYRTQTSRDRLKKQQTEIKDLQAINRIRNTPRPVASTAFAGASAGGSSGGTGNFLATKGDTMTGPFALGPPVDFSIEIDSDGIIDIGESSSNSQYSSNVQLEDIQPNTFTLDTIAGAGFDGQILILRTFAPNSPFTIATGTVANDGNIQTPDSNDVTGVGDLQMIVFVFDESLVINNNTGGTWRLLNTFGDGGGGGFSGNLSDLVIDVNKNWNEKSINNLAGIDLFTTVANNITNMGAITFVSDAAATRGQFGRSDFFLPTVVPVGLATNIPNTANITWLVDGTEKFRLDAPNDKLISGVDLDMNSNVLDNVSRINQDGTVPTSGFINMANSATLAWEASPAGDDGTITFSANERFVFSNNPIVPTTNGGVSLGLDGFRIGTLFVNSIDAAATLTVEGTTILNGATNFIGNEDSDILTLRGEIDIVEIGEPAAPTTNDRLTLYVDSADGITKVRKFGGAVVSLEAGGGGASNEGTQDAAIWTINQPAQFNRSVYMTNSKQGWEISDTAAVTINTIRYVPIFIAETVTVEELGYMVPVVVTGNVSWSMAIYSNKTDGSNYPAARLLSVAVGLQAFSLTFVKTTTSSVVLTPGLYWIAHVLSIITDSSSLAISNHNTFAANTVGYFLESNLIFSLYGYTSVGSTLPVNAPDGLLRQSTKPLALFARFSA